MRPDRDAKLTSSSADAAKGQLALSGFCVVARLSWPLTVGDAIAR